LNDRLSLDHHSFIIRRQRLIQIDLRFADKLAEARDEVSIGNLQPLWPAGGSVPRGDIAWHAGTVWPVVNCLIMVSGSAKSGHVRIYAQTLTAEIE